MSMRRSGAGVADNNASRKNWHLPILVPARRFASGKLSEDRRQPTRFPWPQLNQNVTLETLFRPFKRNDRLSEQAR
jgi:hypothetical protein